ncbi:prolipoprotein diacylglyceryl transferase [Lachnospiraceae bacterium]|nr:prolipoprotein diacylglyceryl transferase [Lachnospiraceae bacterium]
MWEFNTTKCNIAGLPPYMFCAGTGLMVVLALYPFLLLYKDCKIDVFMPRLLYSLPAAFVGAKVLGILLNILKCFQEGKSINEETFFQSGIIYYGGLVGIIVTFIFLSNYKNTCNRDELLDARDSFAILIPLFHSFGRVGCFLSGCCYGIEAKTCISVLYSISCLDEGIITSWRIPTQLIESSFEFLLFLFMLFLFLKNKCCGKLLLLYLFIYPIFRFGLEFIRGDSVRGEFFFLSTSQWISCCLCIYVIIICIQAKGNEGNGKIF